MRHLGRDGVITAEAAVGSEPEVPAEIEEVLTGSYQRARGRGSEEGHQVSGCHDDAASEELGTPRCSRARGVRAAPPERPAAEGGSSGFGQRKRGEENIPGVKEAEHT